MGDEEGGLTYQLETPEGILTSSKKPPYTGQGKATYPNEDRDEYEGEFVEGFRCGWGTYIFKKNGVVLPSGARGPGDVYIGQYEQNAKHGLGKITYAPTFGNAAEEEGDEGGAGPAKRGGFYHGYFTKGKRGSPDQKEDVPGETSKSEGTFTYCNGDVYVGQWKEGKKHGKGTYACAADKSKLKGEWVEGKLATGQWIFPNGTFWSGRFRYNKPFGKGVWVFPNGNQLTGEYEQKELSLEEGEAPPAEEGEEGEEKKDPPVECTFKYGNCVKVKGDAPPRQIKYTQMRT